MTSWNGVAAPAGLPTDIVQYSQRVRSTAPLPRRTFRKRRARSASMRAAARRKQMHDRMAADIAKWRDVIEKAGIPEEQ